MNGIGFVNIPGSGLTAPIFSFEVNSGGQYQQIDRLIFIGHKTAAGSLALNTLVPVADQQTVDTLAGPGSMLREMFRVGIDNAPAAPFYLMAVADLGTVAAWNITVGPLPGIGVGTLVIEGEYLPVTVGPTDTPTSIAQALAAAINGYYNVLTDAMLPLTASAIGSRRHRHGAPRRRDHERGGLLRAPARRAEPIRRRGRADRDAADRRRRHAHRRPGPCRPDGRSRRLRRVALDRCAVHGELRQLLQRYVRPLGVEPAELRPRLDLPLRHLRGPHRLRPGLQLAPHHGHRPHPLALRGLRPGAADEPRRGADDHGRRHRRHLRRRRRPGRGRRHGGGHARQPARLPAELGGPGHRQVRLHGRHQRGRPVGAEPHGHHLGHARQLARARHHGDGRGRDADDRVATAARTLPGCGPPASRRGCSPGCPTARSAACREPTAASWSRTCCPRATGRCGRSTTPATR